jgi:RimJ/RimL family protein N-acetyltransferase
LAPIEFPAAGLDDGTVTVRLIADADLPEIVDACNDPDIARYTTVPAPYGDSDARAWMAHSAAGIAAGSDLGAVVVDSGDGRLLGSVGLHGIDRVSKRCSAGYWVAPEVRNGGIATRAVKLISEFAFRDLGLRRIELWIEPENRASLAVAEAAGFAREGLLRSFMVIAGRRRDMLMYSRLADDPAPV